MLNPGGIFNAFLTLAVSVTSLFPTVSGTSIVLAAQTPEPRVQSEPFPQYFTFLPVCMTSACGDYLDNFQNPASGWAVGEDEQVRYEYLNGEYRILGKQTEYMYLFRAPACKHENYSVEADMRWEDITGNGYGLIFGLADDFSQYYLFAMNADWPEYAVFLYGSSGFQTLVDWTFTPAIHNGLEANHLKVTRLGSQITLEINGSVMGTWDNTAITGPSDAGLFISNYADQPNADARFDNFKITSLPPTLSSSSTGETLSSDPQAASEPQMTVQPYESRHAAPVE